MSDFVSGLELTLASMYAFSMGWMLDLFFLLGTAQHERWWYVDQSLLESHLVHHKTIWLRLSVAHHIWWR